MRGCVEKPPSGAPLCPPKGPDVLDVLRQTGTCQSGLLHSAVWCRFLTGRSFPNFVRKLRCTATIDRFRIYVVLGTRIKPSVLRATLAATNAFCSPFRHSSVFVKCVGELLITSYYNWKGSVTCNKPVPRSNKIFSVHYTAICKQGAEENNRPKKEEVTGRWQNCIMRIKFKMFIKYYRDNVEACEMDRAGRGAYYEGQSESSQKCGIAL